MKYQKDKDCRIFEIQTASFCNADCIICPHRVYKRALPQGVMTMNLFRRILEQIPNRSSTRVVLYFNNEPLLDPLFLERLRLLNELLPKVKLEISTNVSLLDGSYQSRISDIDGLIIDELRLSVFGFTPASHNYMMPGLKWKNVWSNFNKLAGNRKLRKNIRRISLVMIDYHLDKGDIRQAKDFCLKNEFIFHRWGFLDRAKNVSGPSNNIFKPKIAGCEQQRPQKRLHILFTGQVVLCCMDWAVKYVLGDLNQSSIKEVWNSAAYRSIRRKISGQERSAKDFICKFCKLAIANDQI